MHRHDPASEVLTEAIVRYAVDRVRLDPPPLDSPRTAAELRAMAGRTITPRGHRRPRGAARLRRRARPGVHLGRPPALPVVRAGGADRGVDPVRPRRRGVEHLRRHRGWRASGAVFAENEALRWIADLAGLPAGGRRRVRQRRHRRQPQRAARRPVAVAGRRPTGAHDRTRGLLVASAGAHSSVAQAARAMDADVVARAGRRARPAARGPALAATVDALAADDRDRVFAVVATAGTTNAGVVDDLARRRRRLPTELGTWLHVDGAYGGAGAGRAERPPPLRRRRARRQLHRRSAQVAVRPVRLVRPAVPRPGDRPAGPHPARRVPRRAPRRTTTDVAEWNAADYAHHLSRRARGLPFWFSLATHGTDAYRDAVETTLRVTRAGAELVARRAAPRAGRRAGAVGRAVPPPRLGRRRLPARGATTSSPRQRRSSRRRRGAARPCCGGASSTR